MAKGIKCLEDIKDHCQVDGDMWIWKGSSTGGGTPTCKINGAVRSVLRVAYEMRYGKLKSHQQRVWSKTRVRMDVNPENARAGTIAEHNKWRAEGGRMKGVANQIAAIKARDKIGRKFTPEQAQEIRNSTETEAALAVRFGCSKALIGHIRRGKLYRDLAASNASVFSWRPAA